MHFNLSWSFYCMMRCRLWVCVYVHACTSSRARSSAFGVVLLYLLYLSPLGAPSCGTAHETRPQATVTYQAPPSLALPHGTKTSKKRRKQGLSSCPCCGVYHLSLPCCRRGYGARRDSYPLATCCGLPEGRTTPRRRCCWATSWSARQPRTSRAASSMAGALCNMYL